MNKPNPNRTIAAAVSAPITQAREGFAMGKLLSAVAIGAAALAALLPPASANEGAGSIQGVWRVTRHGVNCQTGKVLSSFPAIMAFARGGTWTGYAVGPGSTPAMGSPDYGTWKREPGPGNYSFRLLAYNYDAAGAFDGSTEVSAKLTLTPDAQGFAYDGTVDFFDAAGNLNFSVCGAATATRFK